MEPSSHSEVPSCEELCQYVDPYPHHPPKCYPATLVQVALEPLEVEVLVQPLVVKSCFAWRTHLSSSVLNWMEVVVSSFPPEEHILKPVAWQVVPSQGTASVLVLVEPLPVTAPLLAPVV